MSATGLSVFDSTIEKTNIWLNEIMDGLGWQERQRAYHALRAVLHALRDRLTIPEAADLGAQLPLLVRGLYYEGWHPSGKPVKERKKEEFVAHIAQAFRDDPDVDAEEVTRAVFRVLARHVTAGEIDEVKQMLPAELRELWSSGARTAW
jgi:uncharacterized protein (DUF2267 family)